MSLIKIIQLALLCLTLWISVAAFVGLVRFTYRPLLLLGVGNLLFSGYLAFRLFELPYADIFFLLALVSVLIFTIRYRKSWEKSPITWQKLLFFRN